jgi:chorismate mutase
MHAELEALRRELDDIDAQMIAVLGRRFDLCRRIARVKQDQSIPMMQIDRIAAVKRRATELAEPHAMSAAFVDRVYDAIIDEACRIERDLMACRPAPPPK